MSYLQFRDEDLRTPEGQSSALQQIVEEQNRQFEASQTTRNFQIIAYGKSSVNPVDPGYLPGHVFTKSINHNLGYAPVFMILSFATNKYGGENGFWSFPYYDGMIDFWGTSDIQNINVNVQYNDSVFLDAYTYQFVYYIFNQPAYIT